MKNNIKGTIIGWLLVTVIGLGAHAQATEKESTKSEKKETQEIIIRKKNGKDTRLTLEITSDKVIINGKPIAEFNEEGITINNRKIIVREGNNVSIDLRRTQDGMQRDMREFEKNLDAAKMIKETVSILIKGGGGGQKNLATAGGQNVGGLQAVIDSVKMLISG